MRLLFVIQRYGHEVAGGAERACRSFAEELTGRGHEVEVLTSCAVSYVDWADYYTPGTDRVGDVVVHRLSNTEPREDRIFGPLNARVVHGDRMIPLHLQKAWMQAQGPFLPDLVPWLWEHATSYDAVVVFTYLYWPSWAALPVIAGRVPTLLFPFAHDEPYIRLPLFETMFRSPDAVAFLTEEEQALVQRRFGGHAPSAVTGLGIDLDPPIGDVAEMRAAFGLGDRPYLLALGRVDPAKGLDELFAFFAAYKQRNPGPLALLVMGEPVRPLPEHPDVIPTGFVDEATKHAALAGSVALAHPSYFESFSIVVCEAWVQGRPVLVQGNCAVLDGQVRRSGGGIPYVDFAQFEEAVNLLLGDEELNAALGAAGRRYVARRYRWDAVVDRFMRLVRLVAPAAPVPAGSRPTRLEKPAP